MGEMLLRICLALLLLPAAVRAEPVAAHYNAYAAGLNVLVVDARFDLTPARYRLRLDYRTTGAFGVFVRSQQQTEVDGALEAVRAVPLRFTSSGILRGEPRATEIDYRQGQPLVRQLVPPNDKERETVPEPEQRGTIDTLSAMAQLISEVTRTGRCEGAVRTFDGRRLASLRAWTVGSEVLPPSTVSSFSGPALHCDFEGRQLGGFMLDEDRERLQRPQRGSAWFAAVTAGGPLVPVRISFHTRWFGDATLFIAKP
ncbi:MAG: DUF3108 domain-containing protein [Acetobacteraceae bacterium]|nr:DUF3108 domain-containing protein [Acetobacteraceae bacterium]